MQTPLVRLVISIQKKHLAFQIHLRMITACFMMFPPLESEHTSIPFNNMMNHQADLNIQNAAVYQYWLGYIVTVIKTMPDTLNIITTATGRKRNITDCLGFEWPCFQRNLCQSWLTLHKQWFGQGSKDPDCACTVEQRSMRPQSQHKALKFICHCLNWRAGDKQFNENCNMTGYYIFFVLFTDVIVCSPALIKKKKKKRQMVHTHIGIGTGSSSHPTSAAVRDVSAVALESMYEANKSKVSARV